MDKEWKKNTLLLFFSITLTLLFLEFIFSLFFPQKIIAYQHLEKHTRYDPLLGWTNKPNFTDQGVLCGKRYTRTINAQGFRDTKEYAINKTQGKQRVIVLGDSFIFGEEQDDNELYTTYLQELLGDHYEVFNFGVSGYGTDQEFLHFKKNIFYEPDIVILGFFQNDPLNVLSNKAGDDESRGFKPALRIMKNNKEILSGCCPVPRAEPSKQNKKAFLEHFHTSIFLKEKIQILKEKKRTKELYLRTYHESENTQFKYYNLLPGFEALLEKRDTYLLQETPLDTGIHIITLFLKNFEMQAKKNNFTFVVLNIPINTQVDPLARKDYFAQFSDVTENDFEHDKLNKIMQKIMTAKNNTIYLDLLPLFEREGNIGEKRNIFYPCTRDMHWNGLGSKRAAQETVRILKEKKIIS